MQPAQIDPVGGVPLTPRHAWLPDAYAEGPAPTAAVLLGLLLDVALRALLRFKVLLAANPGAIAPLSLVPMAGVPMTGIWLPPVLVSRFHRVAALLG